MKYKCDVCGASKDIQCEVMLKGTQVDRIYHLCPEHWVEVYRRSLDDFVESNQYKANSYIKAVADRLIAKRTTDDKLPHLTEDDVVDLGKIDVREVRVLRSYEPEEE
jgi:hypothetical protein